MASLTGQTIASTYDALLKITDNGAITASLKQITDGLGNNTPLFLSATTVYVNGNFRVGGALYDVNNEPGTNGQFLVSTGTGVDWRNISEAGLISGSGTTNFIAKFTASGVIGSSIISENANGIGIDISATQKLHVAGNGLFTGTLTASNVSGSNTGDETKASIETKLGAASASNNGFLSSADWSTFNAKQAALNGTGFVKIDGTTISYDNSTYALASRNIATTAPLSGGGDLSANRTLSIAKADSTTDGYLSSDDWATFNSKVPSGRTITINGETHNLAANRTYNVNVGVTSFNTRTGAVVLSSSDVTTALGYTPALNSRIMTINGVGYNLSADRSWSVGTVTSVGTSAPLTGGTITGAGTIGITQANASTDGFLSSTDWNTFNEKQPALGYTAENAANKGVANGYASLDGSGKVPSTQLPSYVDDVVEVANFAALPATGETGKIYITLDTNFVYRWSGSVYVKISEPNAVWGSITGTLSNQTDLQSALNAKVDNTRTLTINGTEFDLSANRTYNVGTVTSVSGTGTVSGLSLSGSVTGSGNLTLGGTLSLTSSDVTTGLGYTPVTNARTLSINGTAFDLTANRSWNVGTVTSVGLELGTTGTNINVANSPVTSSGNITLNIPTASATNRGALSSTDWSTFNNKQNALTLTTTGNSGSATLVGATLNIPTYTLAGLGGQPLLTNPVTGTGTSGYLTRFTGTSTVGNSVIFDNGSQIGIGTTSPAYKLDVTGQVKAKDSGFQFISEPLDVTTFGYLGIGQFSNGAFVGTVAGTNPVSDILRLGTSGSERMRITSAGNVGIGTTSPSSILHLATSAGTASKLWFGQAATAAWSIGNNASANTFSIIDEQFSATRLFISSAGNVGIGTSSPDRKLTISGSDTVLRAVSNTGNVYIQMDSGTTSSYIGQVGNAMYFDNGGSERMRITSSGNVGIGTTSPSNKLVVSANDVFNQDSSGQIVIRGATTPAKALLIGVDTTSNYGYLQSIEQGTSIRPLVLQPFAGNVGIGTSSPECQLHIAKQATGGDGGFLFLDNSAASTLGNKAGIRFATDTGGSFSGYAGYFECVNTNAGNGAADLTFGTWNGSSRGERMRITSGGNVLIGSSGSSGTYRLQSFGQGSTGSWSALFASGNSTSHGISIYTLGDRSSDTTYTSISAGDDNTTRFRVFGNGNVQNVNNSYGAISDIKLKENIVDATPKLEDLLKVKVRNYNLIGEESKQIGVIAQELEEVFPGMIDESEDFESKEVEVIDENGDVVYKTKQVLVSEAVEAEFDEEGNEISPAVEAVYETVITDEPEMETKQVSLGTTTKSVKYSVFVPMLIKAIQEQQSMIQSQQEQIDELKALINKQ